MPVAVWREAMDAHFPGQALAPRSTGDDLRPARRLPRPARPGQLGRRARPAPREASRDERDLRDVEAARGVADAVLYEGYVLYPYRASSPKNQVRWQWGVLMPPDVVAQDPSESICPAHRGARRRRAAAAHASPCGSSSVQHRTVERRTGERFRPVDRLDVGDATYVAVGRGARARARRSTCRADGGPDLRGRRAAPEAEELRDDGSVVGRLVRDRRAAAPRGRRPTVERPESPYAVTLLSVRVENRTATIGETRRRTGRPGCAARSSPATCCSRSTAAAFVSLLDPPEWATGFVGGLRQRRRLPGAGRTRRTRTRVVLSSPIILYDHARARARERDGVLRRARGRRAAQPAHDDALGGGEARGARHRPPHRGAAAARSTRCRPICGTGCTARCATSTR